jgi:hypothetical protein
MKVQAYSFKPGARLKTKIKPDALQIELERVRNKCGLTPKKLVDESRPTKAALHKEFEWNDAIAAEKWREEEAGNIIRVIHVEYETGPDEPQRAYVIERHEEQEQSYEPVHEVLTRQSSRDRLILDLLGDLQAFRRRFIMVSDLSHVVPVLDELVTQIQTTITEEPPRKRRAK